MLDIVNILKEVGFILTQKSASICKTSNVYYFEAEKNGQKIKAILSKGDSRKYQISVSYLPSPSDTRDILSMIEFDNIEELKFLLKSNCHIRFVCNTF